MYSGTTPRQAADRLLGEIRARLLRDGRALLSGAALAAVAPLLGNLDLGMLPTIAPAGRPGLFTITAPNLP